MTENERKKRDEEVRACRVLLESDDWKDPDCRKVLSEYHREGLDDESANVIGVDESLEKFERYWAQKGGANLGGEYHKEGAPRLHVEGEAETYRQTLKDAPASSGRTTVEQGMPKQQALERVINISTFEIVSYAIFRALFRQGIKFPIKQDGMIDMEVAIKDKDILVNTNQFYVALPELNVWRIIYTHKNKKIFELGRGVPNGMKVYRWNALVLGVELWQGNRRAIKAKKALEAQKKS